ncbi:MAG: flagellar hook-basal body complex protein, partial [Okeania sp. SIO3C4]|nr:flagellar hook-basal body complex protein [Okeania sp. SIO3C4]
TTAPGEFRLEFMYGTANEVNIDPGDIIYSGPPGTFSPVKLNEATGESVRTSFIAYDSLGTELRIEATAVLISRNSGGTDWQININSEDDTDGISFIESGDRAASPPGTTWTSPIISFDNFGQLTGAPQINIEIDRTDTGALDPLQIALRFSSDSDNVTALSDTGNGSNIAAVFQDGSPIGVLSSFSFGEDGVITGGFTNGLTRTIGQLAVGTFTNPEGLVDVGNNMFAVGPNSGTALITEAGQFGTGRVIGGALELSNVDLSKEFTDMILTTTGYSAASRVITTTDELLQQLLNLVR